MSGARDAWDWGPSQRQRAAGSPYCRPATMLAFHGMRNGRRCGSCAHFIAHVNGDRCQLACGTADLRRGHTWHADWRACGMWATRPAGQPVRSNLVAPGGVVAPTLPLPAARTNSPPASGSPASHPPAAADPRASGTP